MLTILYAMWTGPKNEAMVFFVAETKSPVYALYIKN